MGTALQAFHESLLNSPHEFLQPSLPLHTNILAYLKNVLDPIAVNVSVTQQGRLQEARRKRKRGDTVTDHDVLRLTQLHTGSANFNQIWEQARRIIDATQKEVESGLAQAGSEEIQEDVESDSDDYGEEQGSEAREDGVDWVYEGEAVDEEEDEDLDADGEITNEAFENEEADHDSDTPEEDGRLGNDEPTQEFISDKFGLNDAFFSIDDFNRQSEFLEQQDAQGADDGADSDEEDVDWDANPLANTVTAQPSVKAVLDAENESDEEAGPTFGDPDASSEEEDEDVEGGDLDGLAGMGNTNDIKYTDFFAPPAQKKRKNKKGRPNPHNFPEKQAGTAGGIKDVEDSIERTMSAVHRDLFEDDDEDEQADDSETQEQLDPADPRSRKSAHERRKAAIAEEIRKLEAANVAKREWTLSGEARASDRPMNSLLEEDLDFERAGKPVPVVTAEVSESIEELIKRRILANDFQDIMRRRPDDLAAGKDGRRGRLAFELDDSKSKKGLAEEYEEEHLRRTDPNFVDVNNDKLAAEQKEIEALWKDISSKLDSLSSWHFRPKQPTTQLDIRVDAPTITMEDARPSAGGDVGGASQLAPQEVYNAGEATNTKEEVVGKSGLPSGREELGKDDKKRRRRREKERIRKAGTNQPAKPESKSAREKKDVVSNLKKGGIKVIGKKGEITDVDGKVAGASNGAGTNAATYKL